MTAGEINVTLQLFGSVLSLMIIVCLFISGICLTVIMLIKYRHVLTKNQISKTPGSKTGGMLVFTVI